MSPHCFTSPPQDPATIAAFLRTHIYRPESLVWLEGYQALLRWRAENEVTGLYAVPYDVETEVGVTKDFPSRAVDPPAAEGAADG
ncbi:hypothetical protein ACQ88U_37855 [Streptomyces lividans]